MKHLELPKRSIYGAAAAAALLAFLLSNFTPELPLFDFSLFWKATQNLVAGENPYLLPAYSSLNGSYAGQISQKETLIPSLSSPPALGMLAFFGRLDLTTAKKAYLWLIYFAFFLSSWVGFRFFLREQNPLTLWDFLFFLLALPLAAFFQALAWGSLAVFAVIGICGFFCANALGSPYLAGGFLVLCAVKPQLFVLFLIYVAWWAIVKRNYLIMLGAVSVGIIGSLVSVILQPRIFEMYRNVLRGGVAYLVTNASIGSILYYFTNQHHSYVMFLPLSVGIVILCLLLRLQIASDLNLFCSCILPISLLLAPYCWGHDYAVCFATAFVSVRYLKISIRSRRLARSLISAGSITGCVLLMVLASFSTKAVSFVAFGVGLTSLSTMVLIFAERELAEQNLMEEGNAQN